MSHEQREHRRALQARIKQCEEDLERLRKESTPSRGDVVRLAERLGREFKPKRRGEPAYKNKLFDLRTLFIPNKSPLKKGTARKILSQLDADLAAMRQRLDDIGGSIDDGRDSS